MRNKHIALSLLCAASLFGSAYGSSQEKSKDIPYTITFKCNVDVVGEAVFIDEPSVLVDDKVVTCRCGCVPSKISILKGVITAYCLKCSPKRQSALNRPGSSFKDEVNKEL